MDRINLEEIQASWPRFTPRVLRLLTAWDDARGILFLADDDSGDVIAPILAAHLTEAVIEYSGESHEEWLAKIEPLVREEFQGSLLKRLPEHICLVVRHLDRAPEWMWKDLRSVLDHRLRPCVVIATAREKSEVPSWLSSFFRKVSKVPNSD